MISILDRIRVALGPEAVAPSFVFYGLIALAFLAAQLKSRRIGVVAIVGMTGWMSGYQLWGWAAIPILVWARRLRPNIVSRGVLPASLILGVIILALRLPWPSPMPGGATVKSEARVQHVLLVDRLFAHWVYRTRNSSEKRLDFEPLPQPFDEVQLQVPASALTPAAFVVDSVDHGSIDSLGARPTVTVVMPVGKPGAARLAAGERTWARVALIRIVASMYLWGAVWGALGLFAASRFKRLPTAAA